MTEHGLTLWRQIGQSLVEDIEKGVLTTDQRLPSSEALAARFGVNRHTVRKAIAHLEAEGKVRIERGRGTYAVVNPLKYNIGPHQLFEQNLAGNNLVPARTVLSAVECLPSSEIVQALKLGSGENVLFVTTLGHANDVVVNYGRHYVASSRLLGVVDLFKSLVGRSSQQFSFSALFEQCGATGYQRQNVRIRSRPPENEEARHLDIAAREHVLVTIVTSVDENDVPLTHAETCFASSRVELTFNFKD
ncbi:phosphonate metabolism transcriptional regulator PhnF [Pseudochelatococcus sp. B33]